MRDRSAIHRHTHTHTGTHTQSHTHRAHGGIVPACTLGAALLRYFRPHHPPLAVHVHPARLHDGVHRALPVQLPPVLGQRVPLRHAVLVAVAVTVTAVAVTVTAVAASAPAQVLLLLLLLLCALAVRSKGDVVLPSKAPRRWLRRLRRSGVVVRTGRGHRCSVHGDGRLRRRALRVAGQCGASALGLEGDLQAHSAGVCYSGRSHHTGAGQQRTPSVRTYVDALLVEQHRCECRETGQLRLGL